MVFTTIGRITPSLPEISRILAAARRFVPVRHRYLYTRNNKLRLRYALPVAACCFFYAAGPLFAVSASVLSVTANAGRAVALVLAAPSPAKIVLAKAGTDKAAQTESDMSVPGDTDYAAGQYEARTRRMGRYAHHASSTADTVFAPLRKAVYAPSPKPRKEIIEIGSGDTLAAVLERNGISRQEIHEMVGALTEFYDPRRMRPGQKLSLRFDPVQEDGDYQFARLDVDVDTLKTVTLEKTDDGFQAAVKERPTVTRAYAHKMNIDLSLYGSSLKAGVPAAVVADTIRIYSWDVDFQRDIREGDAMEVLYEQIETEEGAAVKTGDVLYARLNVNGRDIPVYRFEDKDGIVDYYTPDGKSIRRALLSTPIEGARLSSGFGPRKHPILGYDKMHKGVDFAAPMGTPIYAAGDGIVERANRYGAYGNYIRIRHNTTIKTAYAHLNGFAKGVTAGAKVRQGQVIGYVGTTGRSTGPHLHYEVLMNGEQVNPRSVKVPQGKSLSGQQLAAFRAQVQRINQQYAELTGSLKYAALNRN